MALIKVKNICNESGVGAFYHSASYSPHSHTLPFEPYLGDVQLKLNEETMISEDFVKRNFSYFKDLRDARIIDFSMPVEDWNKNFKETIAELKNVSEQFQKNIEEGQKILESEEKEVAVELIDSMDKVEESLKSISEKIEEKLVAPLEKTEEVTKEEIFKKVGKKKR